MREVARRLAIVIVLIVFLLFCAWVVSTAPKR